MTLHDDPPDGGGDCSGQLAPATGAASSLPRSISELRAGQRTLSAMLMRLFDELDHRRLQLAEQSRGSAAGRPAARRDDGASRAADEQIAALERALAAAQTHHAQRLAEFAVTRIELAAARIELTQVAGARAGDPADERAPEPDALSSELEILRSSAVELARELADSRRRSHADHGERAGEYDDQNGEQGERNGLGGKQNGQPQPIAALLDDARDADPGPFAGPVCGPGAGAG